MKENMLDESWNQKAKELIYEGYFMPSYLAGASEMQKRVIEEIDEIVNFGKYEFMSSESKLLRRVIELVKTIKTE